MKHLFPFAVFTACLLPLPLRAADPPQGERYALLVGVSRYVSPDLRPLPYSERDVTDLAAVLRQSGYKPDNVVVLSQAAGKDNPRFSPLAERVRAELALLLKNRKPGDTVLVAFAGHGLAFRGDDDNYFCPADAEPLTKKNLLALGEVYKQLEGCKAGLKLLLVDACRNDPFQDKTRAPKEFDGESATRPAVAEPPGGVVAFFSCSRAEKAFENDELKHGVFFHFVIEALKGGAAGDGEVVTLPGLADYVSRHVADFVRAKYGRAQTPELMGKLRGVFPLVRLAAGLKKINEHLAKRELDKVFAGVNAELRRNPRNAPAYALRGDAFRLTGQLDKALTDYAEALNLDPGCLEAYRGRGFVHSARKNWVKAADEFREALRLLRPGTAEDYAERARFHIGVGVPSKDAKTLFGEALEDAWQALRLNPGLALAYVHQGHAYRLLGQDAKALESLQTALRLDPANALGYYRRAEVYKNLKKYTEALADLSEAIRLDPTNATYLFDRGNWYRFMLKASDKALADCDEALRLDPKFVLAWNFRVSLQEQMGKYERAIDDLGNVIRYSPETGWPLTKWPFVRRAEYHAKLKAHDKALADYAEAIRLDPRDASLYAARAEIYAATGDTARAQADKNTANKLREGMK
jgi:tetratricopeptide (TPR) repeat protein